ncbi:MAG TPA: hypothetical protein VK184_11365 [Nostocaceae cyanobacterium]|nr:hypothetical protein [Nostocaceae cyanobacterium]
MFRIYIPTNDLYAVAISPNHGYLATASADKTARIWKVANSQELICLKHEGYVISLAFSPDSQYLATASSDGTARIWTVASGKEITRIQANDLTSITFSPDGKYLATTNNDGIVEVWLWRREDLINEACNRLTRNLTPEEWKQYIGNEPYCNTCSNLP